MIFLHGRKSAKLRINAMTQNSRMAALKHQESEQRAQNIGQRSNSLSRIPEKRSANGGRHARRIHTRQDATRRDKTQT